MRKLLTAIVSAVLLFIPSLSQAQAPNAQLTGSVTYRERMALPPDAVIDVQLIDTSVADIAAQTVAADMINAEGRQVPVPFTLTYDPAKIEPAHRYSVRANIRSGDGMLMFSSTQAYPVLTHGAPAKVNLILHTVGHGAKPGAVAKKQTPQADSEGTASASPSAPPTPGESVPPVTTSPPPPNEPAAGATTVSPPEPEKSAAQAEPTPAPAESAAGLPSSTPAELAPAPPPASTESVTAPAPQETTPAEVAPSNSAPVPESTRPSTEPAAPAQAATEQAAPPAEPPAPATSEAPPAPPESKRAEAPPAAAEPNASPESKTEPTTPTPEAKAAEPEAPLPEAPSASKRAELEAAAPDSAEPDSSSPPEPNKALTPLADTQWKLIQLGGEKVVIDPLQKPVTLAFSPEGRRIAGSAGCNSYLGTFTDDHGVLELHPGNMTMMSCAEAANSRERKFIDMLRSADGYKLNGDVLLLTSNGKTVAKFQNNQ